MTKIVLNGREVEVDPKQPLIHACHNADVDVPMYCYHPGLTPVGSCRICQVEVQQGDMPPRVVVACRTPVAEGMVVNTEAPKAHEARKQCLEFLLKNHPLDCPICDKAGECDLQDFAFDEGQGEGRSVEPRRKLEKRKSLGDVIVLDQERCILCSRCVRFFEDVTEKPQLTVAGLGSRSVISTFLDRPLEGNYQGNLADVCPVGALTLKKFRFQARVWNLQKSFSTCGECSRGCSVTVEVLRNQGVKRLRPRYNPEVNRWWMCDAGRFSFEERASSPRFCGAAVRGVAGLEETPVAEALDAAAGELRQAASPAVVVSPWLTVEEGERALALAKALGVEAAFVAPETGEPDELLHTGDPCPNRRGLTELGLVPLSPAEARERLAASDVALAAGERVFFLLGSEAMDLEGPRLVAIDTHRFDAPATAVAVACPDRFERAGTWVNVDGHRGRIVPATPAPDGTPPLTSTLDGLRERLAGAPATEAAAR